MPDEDDLGLVAIQANDRTLLLNRQQNKAKRTVQVVSVIRTPKHKVPECQILLQNPEPVARSNANTSGGTAEVATAEGRGRSRSPARGETTKTEPAFPYADKFEALDCGGGGDCGYLCLAAGMGFDKGEPWEDLQSKLLTRSRTIRNDLYKHIRVALVMRLSTKHTSLPSWPAVKRKRLERCPQTGIHGWNPPSVLTDGLTGCPSQQHVGAMASI